MITGVDRGSVRLEEEAWNAGKRETYFSSLSFYIFFLLKKRLDLLVTH